MARIGSDIRNAKGAEELLMELRADDELLRKLTGRN